MSHSQVTHYRAKVASLTRSRSDNDPQLLAARTDLRAERLAEQIARTVAEWPPLTPSQLDRLAILLRGGETA